MAMLEVKNLTTYYKTRMNEKVCSVDNVSFTLEEGRSLGIAGESGCGKSTLAMSVMGYYFPPLNYESGSIIIDGKDITSLEPDTIRAKVLGSDIAYIPQAAMNALNPTRKIMKFIEDVLKAHGSDLSKAEMRNLARERFNILNLPDKVLDHYAVELSGGMKQRTIIAISTILNPKILIADEPSSALDVSSQKIVIKLLHDLMEKGFVRAMLFITHELPLLFNVTDDIMVMYAGEIVERGTAKQMVFDPIMPYSKGLMNSIIVPEEGTRGHVLMAIPGAPPNLKLRPSGCRFAERCRFADAECHKAEVPEQEAGPGRSYRCRHKLEDLFRIYENDLPSLLDDDKGGSHDQK
ncbi:ABC transporter ATP-binding protein [Leadbettera azotonutricia]|uniref:Oligopeptide transport ATP-binding protein OppD n=1 Tax=Leadbettera azotonutricia (strain ATCC BAA-888 / DSM 13862 / ZAS-9) TaxID=545695 RepID=F5Y6S1_LEAAZ|nr:ABC transporter ATP-binding protein [Leadbettera azotonutricia]AEF81334.1 oligopeptide transport ATP-binding protein OppD [Leadbettera azotonutricia ZAS-9]